MPEAITPLIRAPWRRRSRAGAWALAALGLISTGVQARAEDTSIGVYSGRHYNSDQKLYQQFTAKTGIQVKLLEAKDDSLIERLRQEGKNTPADVLVLVDAARLERATSLDLLQPARSRRAASTSTSTSAGVFLPSWRRRSIRLSSLASSSFTWMPVLAVNCL